MSLTTNVCEACKTNQASIKEPTEIETQSYHLCEDCHERLLSYALKPLEWYNLAVIHSPMSFMLHDDFYEEDGEATQPEEDVVVTESDLAPSLQDVQGNLEALIDFAITRWYLEEDVIRALKKHNANDLLVSIRTRFQETDTYDIKSRMLEIAGEAMEGLAAEWIRELWVQYDEEWLIALSIATACCLPLHEGLQLVYGKLEVLPEKEQNACVASCLYRFRSPDVLVWIEKNCRTFHDNWGRLAAVCYPTWKTMKSWLNSGRPLSLVALDAMAICATEFGDPIIERYKPQILNTDKSEIDSVIGNYLQHDSVPRVKNKSARILEDKDIIFSSNAH